MEEIIVPDDGIIYKTKDGKPVMELAIREEGNVLRIFDVAGSAKIGLAAQRDCQVLFIGDTQTGNTLTISCDESMSAMTIASGTKNISIAINKAQSEISFKNEEQKMTNKIYVTEKGGQMGFSDHNGNLLLSMGVDEEGGCFHLMNSEGETVISLGTNDADGTIYLLDKNKQIKLMLANDKEKGVINILDNAGHIIWTTLQE